MSGYEITDELTCKELVELVTDYLEESLDSTERSRFDAHLSKCTGCTNYVSQMRRTIQTTGYLSEDELSPEAERDLLEAFRGWKREQNLS
jgi:anti-sigma factor RsiW